MDNTKATSIKEGTRVRLNGSHYRVHETYRGGPVVMLRGMMTTFEANADHVSVFAGETWTPIRMIADQKLLQALFTVASQAGRS